MFRFHKVSNDDTNNEEACQADTSNLECEITDDCSKDQPEIPENLDLKQILKIETNKEERINRETGEKNFKTFL